MSERHCSCQEVDRSADPCGHSDTSEGCATHDPQSIGECPTCRSALHTTGADDIPYICSVCGDEFDEDCMNEVEFDLHRAPINAVAYI